MNILLYLPETVESSEWPRRVSIIKRQLAVLLKVNEQQFKDSVPLLSSFLQSFFYFGPHDDDQLICLVARLLKRFVSTGNSIDFYWFIDSLDVLPEVVVKQVAPSVTNIPPSFTSKFVRQNPEFSAAFGYIYGKVDETVALLDDKLFVKEFGQRILDSQYEDEYIDNYDFADDSTNLAPFTEYTDTEVRLFRAYLQSPALLDRASRRSHARTVLCSQLKMANEQVEGWATMLARNPNREAILRRFSQWDMNPKNK